MNPQLLLTVEAGDWPPEQRLAEIATRAVTATLSVGGLRCAAKSELSLLFTDDAAIAQINAQWRGIDRPTNVLSFPGEEIEIGATGGPMLGDIALAHETLEREARLEGKRFEHHLTHLIVHGLLHIFGYDHGDDEEAELMEALERRILASLDIADPYGETASHGAASS